jgi:type II secretory pathway pseudopilin PulG
MKIESDPAKLGVRVLSSRVGRPRAIGGGRLAFTLIELLVVFGLIAALAGLIIGAASAGFNKRIRSRVQTERDSLVNAIEYYKQVKGFYPPDNVSNNTNDPVMNSLFYELTGTITVGSPTPTAFSSVLLQDQIDNNTILTNFNVSGFVNAAQTNSEIKNFYKTLKPGQYTTLASGVTLLVVPYKGPITPNTWRYNASMPAHNPDSFDLWADVIIGSKTITIGNWRD